jgi:hypothetical protein
MSSKGRKNLPKLIDLTQEEVEKIHKAFKWPGNWALHPPSGGPYPNLYANLEVPKVTSADIGRRVSRLPPTLTDGSWVGLDSAKTYLISISDAGSVSVLSRYSPIVGDCVYTRPASEYWFRTDRLVGVEPDLSKSFTDEARDEYISHFTDSSFGGSSCREFAEKLRAKRLSSKTRLRRRRDHFRRIRPGLKHFRPLVRKEKSSVCVVCLEKQREIVFVTCGHLICCQVCSGKVSLCPVCREDIQRRQRVFLS